MVMSVYIDRTFAFLLLLLLYATGSAQKLPGGDISVRPPHSSERGQHPQVIVQTVPDATTTATCLAIRYRQPGTKGPTPGTAHLLEHLLFRTRPGGKPGRLLLRNEINGGQSKAWVTASEIVLSEEVASEEGLESLALQLDRLSAPPTDNEGYQLERQAIRSEIRSARTAEESGRREILRRLGHPTQPEGSWEEIKSADSAKMEQLLDQLSLDEDVVISIVGPHTHREVRSYLSKNLKTLSCRREQPRPELKAVESPLRELRVDSPAGFNQRSLFFRHQVDDPRILTVTRALLSEQLPNLRTKLERESTDLLRLDLGPSDGSLEPVFEKLTQAQSLSLATQLHRKWLEDYEPLQRRAEMMALASLRGQQYEAPISPEDFPALLEASYRLLESSRDPLAELFLTPTGNQRRSSLFQFATSANRERPAKPRSEKLPNGLGLTIQQKASWPVVALSGFFRISPPLRPEQMGLLQKSLRTRKDLSLEYEVKPGGLFFHTWGPSRELKSLLTQSASELKMLAQSEDLLEGTTTGSQSPIDDFFLASQPKTDSAVPLLGRKVVNPNNGHLVIVGSLEEQALDQGLRPQWSGWFGKESPPALKPQRDARQTSKNLEANKVLPVRAGAQPVLLIGFSGPSRSSPNFLAFNLAIQTLAGRPATSLMARRFVKSFPEVNSIRLFPLSSSVEGQSQIWIVALRLSERIDDPVPLVEKASAMISALANNPLPKKELARTRSFLKGSLALSSATASGRARVLAHAEFYRLSKTYANDFAGLYDNLTPPLVQAVCRPFLAETAPRWLYLKPRPQKSQDS